MVVRNRGYKRSRNSGCIKPLIFTQTLFQHPYKYQCTMMASLPGREPMAHRSRVWEFRCFAVVYFKNLFENTKNRYQNRLNVVLEKIGWKPFLRGYFHGSCRPNSTASIAQTAVTIVDDFRMIFITIIRLYCFNENFHLQRAHGSPYFNDSGTRRPIRRPIFIFFACVFSRFSVLTPENYPVVMSPLGTEFC